jgi:hypothetical protein
MADRHIYMDKAPGETRGVITLAGRPERLLIERDGLHYPRLGERFRARVTLADRALGLAMLDLGQGQEASLRLKADRPPPVQGQALEVEIVIEPQGGKPAVARVLGEASGPPSRLSESLALAAQLQALAPGAPVTAGPAARAVADEAEDEALAVEHALPGGGRLAIEPTRALVAVDVDLGQGAARDAKRSARQANLNAIAALGRLLRLKALGGLVVVDLVGRGHDGQALAHAAQTAFAADQPGVAIGPITKFGTLELALPRRRRPLREILCRGDGRPSDQSLSDQSLALRLLRAVEREALADPGARLQARCAPDVASAAAASAAALEGIVGRRFEVVPDPAMDRDNWDIGRR